MPDHSERQLLLLGLLRRQEMHGYQINEFIDEQMAFCVDLKRSTAYYLLERLRHEGYVTEEAERTGNRPERRVYRITPAGETHFQALLRANLATYTPPTYANDIGLIFHHHLPPAEVRTLLETRRQNILAHQQKLKNLATVLPTDHLAIIRHHLIHVTAELDWIEEQLT